MPANGAGALTGSATRYPAGDALATEPLTFDLVEVFQIFHEVTRAPAMALLPPALHPSVPCAVTITVVRCGASPWGPFTLAELRLASRVHDKARNLLLGAVVDGRDAIAGLRDGWGMACTEGQVRLGRYYDTVEAVVSCQGATILDCALLDPDPIAHATVPFTPWLNVVRTDRGPRLLAVDPLPVFAEEERGRPVVRRLDADAWGAPSLELTLPIGAFYAVAELTLAPPSTTYDPAVEAGQGVEQL